MNANQHEWYRGPQWLQGDPRRADTAALLERAGAAYAALELVTVSRGARPSAIVDLALADVPGANRACAAQGLMLTPLWVEGAGPYLRCAVHPPSVLRDWLGVTPLSDDRIGALLGYPECCRRHFDRTWALGRTETFTDTAGGAWELNQGLRWLGPRVVPHLPCSGSCEASLALAHRYLEIGRSAGVDVDSLEAALRIPLSYSRNAGIGIVDAGNFRVVVGACEMPTTWEDNQFGDAEWMERAHRLVERVAGPVGSALDIGGCGDGALVARFERGCRGDWVGVERDEGKIARGRYRHPGVVFVAGRIEDPLTTGTWRGLHFDVILLAPVRFTEYTTDPKEADALRGTLRGRRLVAYDYGDEGHAVEARLSAAGMRATGPVEVDGPFSVCEAEVI